MNTELSHSEMWKAETHRKSGFTLVEIMVVVMVIGLLSGIAIPSFMKARETSQNNKAISDLRVISHALDQLAMDTGLWPDGLQVYHAAMGGGNEVWDLSVNSAGLVGNDGTFTGWVGPYIKKTPIDPWGNPYFFDQDYVIGGQVVAVVGSFGPNGQGPNMYDSDDVYIILER